MWHNWLRALPASLKFVTRSAVKCEEVQGLGEKHDFPEAVRAAHGWHFAMLRDVDRAQKFKRALQNAIRPGDCVLDVGAGTGLLSMMAAKAGGEVYACEANQSFAKVASCVMRANGVVFPLFAKSSHSLRVPEDLPRHADVMVSETLSSSLFGEGILATFRDAHLRLLAPGARVIPSRVVLSFAVVEWDSFHFGTCAERVEGFDISAFNAFRVEHRLLEAPSLDPSVKQLTLPEVAVAVDLADPEDPLLSQRAFAREFNIPVSKAGTCHFVLVWWDAWLDHEGAIQITTNPFEELPAFRQRHWCIRCQPLPIDKAVHVQHGDMLSVRLTLRQDRPDPQPHFTVSRCYDSRA